MSSKITNRKNGEQNKEKGYSSDKDSAEIENSKNKVEFVERYSLLDDFHSDSEISKSVLKGFYVAGVTFGFFFLVIDPVLRYIQKGEVLTLLLFNSFERDLILCILHWPLYYAYSYTSVLVQNCIIKGYGERKCQFLHHFFELALFAYTIYIIMERDWGTTHCLFLSFLCCTHYFKMHSYRVVNEEYRQEKNPAYPQNISIENFTLYMWMPVLVYRHSYPRNKSVNFKYIAYKSFMGGSGILFGYIICSDSLIPTLNNAPNTYWFETMFRMIFPLTVLQIVLFWVVFENILNVFGELTRFADREFYQDWWNSTSFEEYNRKWNRPVHFFLYNHLYLSSIKNGFSKKLAQIFTFFFSAVLHEWVFCLIFRRCKPVVTVFMLQQIPLITITKGLKGKGSGNQLFWFGMIIGPSLITIGYLYLPFF